MTIEVTIRDSAGTVIAHSEGDAFRPLQWRCPPDKPITEIEPRSAENSIQWVLWGWTLQPMVVREVRREK